MVINKSNNQNSSHQVNPILKRLYDLSNNLQIQFIMLVYKIIPRRLVMAIQCFSLQVSRNFISRQPLYPFSTVKQYNPNTDYYKNLNLTQQASASQIKKSYYQMAKKYHPDSNPGFQQQFKAVNQAYIVLSNEELKKEYDGVRQNLNISKKRQKQRQQTNKSYYYQSQTNWTYVRRGQSFYYGNPDGSYSRKVYGFRNAGTYGNIDQAFQMARKARMYQQPDFDQQLKNYMSFIKQQQLQDKINMQRKQQMDKIIKQMERQYQQRQNRALQSTLLYRITMYLWSKVIKTYVSFKSFLKNVKK